MGEIKSVKVDNWGVFFLQKLQNFFNKTDYCDLTLQFNDNSQLKVHRLVLSACTDYFNVLEQTCEVLDDALIMPNELQADVVVPIVNFMYTGTLEFELKMYGKLLRTAKEMNMTVLLKLLEAHRRTMEGVNRTQRASSPKGVRKRVPVATTQTSGHSQNRPGGSSAQPQQQQQRRILTANTSTRQRQSKIIATNVAQSQTQHYRPSIGSSSSAKSASPQKVQRLYEATSISVGGASQAYESALQFKEEQHDEYESQLCNINRSTSPFEELRKGYSNSKRPASATFISPPAKKPNIEDVKEFAEQQRMRKQIAAEYGEDQEYEGTMMDDDIHSYDDDDDTAAAFASSSRAASVAAATTTAAKPQHQQKGTGPSIIIKQEPNEKPTIVVKESVNSKMNHAKIISAVFRQYPHLVNSNKNLKLKITPNIGGQSQRIILKKEQIDNISAEMKAQSGTTGNGGQQTLLKQASATTQQTILKPVEKSAPKTVAADPPVTALVAAAATSTSAHTAAVAPPPAQKRRIDSKTMHALIAQGAENTTGPWLCLRCGVNGRPISIPSYRGFRRHLINTHKETIDPALCEHCGWRSSSNRGLHFHIQVEHKIRTMLYTFPECLICADVFINRDVLNQHMVTSHPTESQQQCLYCYKIFGKEIELYTHVKTYHKREAIDDGIIDYSDEEEEADESMDTHEDAATEDSVKETQNLPSTSGNTHDKKIKILSDISLPSAGSLIKLEPSTETASSTTISGSIVASMGQDTAEEFITTAGEIANVAVINETKFVSADGSEMVLTEEQRKEIMSQLNQEHDGGVVMVLNESAFPDDTPAATAAIVNEEEHSEDELVSEHPESEEHVADESEEHPAMETSADENEDYEDSNIYTEFISKAVTPEIKKEASGLEESKGSDNLKWAEDLLTAHELKEESLNTDTTPNKEAIDQMQEKDKEKKKDVNKDEAISKKLKELSCDWSDDEIDEEDEFLKEAEDISHEHDLKSKDADIEKSDAVTLNEETKEEDTIEKESNMIHIAEEGKKKPDEEEDEIDIAMKSLHKEESVTEGENVADNTNPSMENSNNMDKSKKNMEETDDTVEKPTESITVESTTDKTNLLYEDKQIAVEEKCNREIECVQNEIIEDNKKDISDIMLEDLEEGEPAKVLPVMESLREIVSDEGRDEVAKKIGLNENIEIEKRATHVPDTSSNSKTEETIKSLISEWADDDGDEDEEVREETLA